VPSRKARILPDPHLADPQMDLRMPVWPRPEPCMTKKESDLRHRRRRAAKEGYWCSI
jgi:hypothetical protein